MSLYLSHKVGLKGLRAFIEEKNPLAAQRVAASIMKGINQLKTFPYLGVEIQLAPNLVMIRDLIIANYIVRYLLRSNEINIFRVRHHKENHI